MKAGSGHASNCRCKQCRMRREKGESPAAQQDDVTYASNASLTVSKGELGIQLLAAAFASADVTNVSRGGADHEGTIEAEDKAKCEADNDERAKREADARANLYAVQDEANGSRTSDPIREARQGENEGVGSGLVIAFTNSSGDIETLRDLDPNITTQDLKRIIHQTIHWATDEDASCLILDGEILPDSQTLAAIGFERLKNSVVVVTHEPYCQPCHGETQAGYPESPATQQVDVGNASGAPQTMAKEELGIHLLAAALTPVHEDQHNFESGLGLTITFTNASGEAETLQNLDPNITIQELKQMIRQSIHWAPHENAARLLLDGEVLPDPETLSTLGFELLENPMLMVAHVPYCRKCGGECRCPKCHGNGSWSEDERRKGNGKSTWTCSECGKQNSGCTTCKGPCRCPVCHGNDDYCARCSNRGICWGGDTQVFMLGNGVKKVRDCNVGDQVLTVKGPRRIVRIWDTISHRVDTEVCCVDGVWMTSGHPVVMDGEWQFPAFLADSIPWTQVKLDVPDLYNFELEGHCDMILLWGGGDWPLVVSCTIGKYLGPRFGFTYANLRSTRCAGSCAQCDVVYKPGIDFARVPASLRWAKQLPAFPQVEWDDSHETDVELAEACKARFQPYDVGRWQAPRFCSSRVEHCSDMTFLECPLIR